MPLNDPRPIMIPGVQAYITIQIHDLVFLIIIISVFGTYDLDSFVPCIPCNCYCLIIIAVVAFKRLILILRGLVATIKQ